MAAKPTNIAEWATGAAPIVEPSTPQKQAGWPVDFKPPAQWFNWWQKLVHLWIVWLDAFETEAHTWSGFQTFSAFENTSNAIFNGTTSFNAGVTFGPTASLGLGCSVNFGPLASAATPLFTRNAIASVPNLIFEQQLDVAGQMLRLYAHATRGFVVTHNAAWSVGGSNWVKDIAGSSWMMTLGNAIRHFQHQPVTTPFADGLWTELFTSFGGLASGQVWAGRAANDGVVIPTAVIPQPAWTNLTISSNLTPVALNPPQYYKDSTGRVWFRGRATANTTIASGTQVATLPFSVERLLTFAPPQTGFAVGFQLDLQPPASSDRVDLLATGTFPNGGTIIFDDISYRSI